MYVMRAIRTAFFVTNIRQRESLTRYTMSILHLRLDVRIWQCMCVLVSLLILADGLFTETDKLLINTKWGFVHGKWSRTVRNRPIASFLGIPYALPPVGELRFRSPQSWNRTWTTIRDTTVDAQKCIQVYNETEIFKIIGSEDCLYLNVFVPYSSDEHQKPKNLSVLAVVHGGGYMKGSSDSELYAPNYLLEQDIILVTMNYRVSILGFFSTLNHVSPGNYGIKDVKMALEWIQENIHSFGGNPKSVTLMGFSAGAGLTHILALSKKTEGLFHRYILHSGSATAPWSFHPRRRYRQVCLELAKLVGCLPKKNANITASNETTTENPKGKDVRINAHDEISDYRVKDDEEILKCMRTVNSTRLETMTQHFTVWSGHPWCIFGPTIENDSEDAILTMHPLKIMKDGLFRDIPAIFQVVKDEGLLKTLQLFTKPKVEDELIENFEEYLPYFLEYEEVISNTSIFVSALQDFYFNGNVTLGITHNITEMMSDGLIIWPVFQALQYHHSKGNSNIYFSFFTYQGTFTHTFTSGISMYYGIAHGDDVNYLFPMLNNILSNMLLYNTFNDVTMINIITEIWANFVIEGIPKTWRIPAWPNYRDHHKFMRFGIDREPETVVQTDFLSDRMEFWEKLTLNELGESMNDVFVSEPPEDKPTGNAIAYEAYCNKCEERFCGSASNYWFTKSSKNKEGIECQDPSLSRRTTDTEDF